MRIHDGRVTITDRIALSAALHQVAEGFVLEAELWTESTDAPPEFMRSARLLSELARHVLTGRANYAKAEAYHEAGRIKLGQAIAARRFFTALSSAPGNRVGDQS